MENAEEIVTKYLFLPPVMDCNGDLAVVLGTRYTKPVKLAATLFHKGHVPLILASGGTNRVTLDCEADLMRRELRKLDVPDACILCERESSNTLENALFSARMIAQRLGWRGIRRIIGVVKHHHSRRALMTLRKQFPDWVEVVPYCYQIRGLGAEDWWTSQTGLETVAGELSRIRRYLAKGDLVEIPDECGVTLPQAEAALGSILQESRRFGESHLLAQ